MIEHKQKENGFKYIEIKNEKAEAKIALQGAHVFHYKELGKPSALWLSELAYFEEGKAIRGGIPICFPWFGKHKTDATLAQHGFARTALWTLTLEEEIDRNTTHIQLQLLSDEKSKALWNYEFDVCLDVVVGSELSVTLSVHNTDSKPFEITTALHSYFNVSNIDEVLVKGLDNTSYYDALDKMEYVQKGEVIIDKEVDRVYYDVPNNIELHDGKRKIELTQSNSNSLVVWNPWIEKSKQMADMNNDAYKNMLCLETGNIGRKPLTIEANERCVYGVVLKSYIVEEG